MTTALATTQQAPNFAISLREAAMPRSLADVQAIAQTVAASGMFGVKNPDDAMVRMLTGMELGLSPMQSLRGISSVGGKPIVAADVAVAVVLSSGKAEYFDCVETTTTIATYETKRVGRPAKRHSFTIEEAKLAELTGKDIWRKYPAAMLRARASIALARMVYQDLLNGIYTEDELGGTSVTAEVTSSHAVETTVRTVEPIEVIAPAVTVTPSDVSFFVDRISDATTLAELADIAADIKRAAVKGDDAKRLKAAYAAKRGELTPKPPVVATVEVSPEDDGR